MALVAAVVTPQAFADTYSPNTTTDHAPNGCTQSDCTLREAVIAANQHSGPDQIVLQGGATYVRSAVGTNENASADGDLDVTDALTITSSNDQRATIDAAHNERVIASMAPTTLDRVKLIRGDTRGQSGFDATGAGVDQEGAAGVLTVTRSVIAKNVSNQYGGAIYATNATIQRSQLTGNQAQYAGGAIISNGPLEISKSTISGNSVSSTPGGVGGGIDLETGGSQITDSTISGNQADNTGGIYNDAEAPDVAQITNSTIDGNTGGGGPGGLAGDFNAALELNAVTVAHNQSVSGFGGGIGTGSASFTIENSLLAGNSAEGQGPDCFGSVVSGGHNLVQDPTGCSGFGSRGDLMGLTAAQVRIDPLADNGGPTRTDKIRWKSRAVDAGGSTTPAQDQRGHERNAPDIGAYERR